jgi:hypothetical protein
LPKKEKDNKTIGNLIDLYYRTNEIASFFDALLLFLLRNIGQLLADICLYVECILPLLRRESRFRSNSFI